MSINSPQEVYRFLDAIPKFKDEGKEASDFSLNRFRQFCNLMDNPQQNFPMIHVAGSNGKGSTCTIMGAIYRKGGHKVGIYTSPHLLHFTERFTINEARLNEEELIQFFEEYLPQIKSLQLTYFEISTAIAFWWFSRKNIDIAIIETGLGGRLDATNIITPLVSVITSITLDHTDILGDTLQKVTREKAGIIKPGVPVIVGKLPDEAKREIKKIAAKLQSNFLDIDNLKPIYNEGTYCLNVSNKIVQLQAKGRAPVQIFNIAIAWKVATLLKKEFTVTESQIREGIDNAGALEANRGRFERLHPQFDWYFDGAHNVEAIKAMKQAVETVGRVKQATLMLSLMRDKINKKMMIEFLEFKKIVYYTLSTKRGAAIQDIHRWLPQAKAFPESQKSRLRLLDKLSTKLVIFGGSFYFYPTVQSWITTYTKNR